jgi:hypothetical protein
MEINRSFTFTEVSNIPFIEEISSITFGRSQPLVIDSNHESWKTIFNEFKGSTFQINFLNIVASNGVSEWILKNQYIQSFIFQTCDYTGASGLTPMFSGNAIRTLTLNDSNLSSLNFVAGLPTSWNNLYFLQILNLQRCRLSTTQVNQIALSVEARILAGMSGNFPTGTITINLNGAGATANGSLTQSNFTSAGWTAGAGFIQKIIAGKTIRINHN